MRVYNTGVVANVFKYIFLMHCVTLLLNCVFLISTFFISGYNIPSWMLYNGHVIGFLILSLV
jgi:hypothetical protein